MAGAASPSYNLVNGRIGVVNRNAGFREQFCGGRFSHPDRAGQPKDYHSAIAIRRIVRISHTEQPLASQKREQWQQRQTEDGEMIAFDTLEQMDPQPFKLIGADA